VRLGIGSYTYGWAVGGEGDRPERSMSAIDLIERAVELGVSIVQLCDNLPPSTYEDESIDRIISYARQKRISIELGTRGISRENLQRFASIANRLSSRILRVVIDTADDHPAPEEVIDRLGPMTEMFEEMRIILAIENHDRFRSSALAGIIRALNSSHIAICLDTANSFGAGEAVRETVEILGPYTVCLHVKDFAIRRLPHLMGFTIEGRPAGHGMLEIPWVLQRLSGYGREANAIIELWTPPESSLDQTIRKEADWAQQSVRTMRQWIND
jgi:sugar phosphate isomerase/epimerase